MSQTNRPKVHPKPARARNNPELVLGQHESYSDALARAQKAKEDTRAK